MTLTGVKVGSRTLFVIILLAVFISSYGVISREMTGTNTLSEENDPNEGKVATPMQKSSNKLIPDPTGQTRGYYRPNQDQNYFELFGSRGQTYRHFYNLTSGKYTYQSDYLVKKAGVVEGTEWVTAEEYPTQFVVMLEDESFRYFETIEELNDFWESTDKMTSIAVGIEGFGGLMCFYVQDHAQYLFWPRLSDGSLNLTGNPLYAIYPAVHIETLRGQSLTHVLTDHHLYTTNVRDSFAFSITPETLDIQFSQRNVRLFDSQWDFVHGFKYKPENQQFHMITKIRCQNRPFQDIGVTYEITKSPMTTITPDMFILSNMTHSSIRPVTESWTAKDYFKDYDPQVSIFSTNGEGFVFNFNDMKESGFTENCLEYDVMKLPDQSISKILGAGMMGYGYYEPNTWINIDPHTGTLNTTDNYDLYKNYDDTWYTGYSVLYVGIDYVGGQLRSYEGFIAFDTGIIADINDTWNSVLSLYLSQSRMESGEGMDVRIYNVPGNNNASQAREDSQSQSDTDCYSTAEEALMGSKSPGWHNMTRDDGIEGLTDYWGSNRDDYNDSYINLRLIPNGCDGWPWGNDDYYKFLDSQYSSGDYAPQLKFTYKIESWGLGTTICNGADWGVNWGSTDNVEIWMEIPDSTVNPSNRVCLVVSIKTPDNRILQLGAGWDCDYQAWTTFAFIVYGSYGTWINNSRTPWYSPGSTAYFKIWSNSTGSGKYAWNLFAENGTGYNWTDVFLNDSNSQFFKNESQEVVTFESFTDKKSDFGSSSRIIFKMKECRVNGTTVDEDIYIEASVDDWDGDKGYHIGTGSPVPDWMTIKMEMAGLGYKQVWWYFDKTGGSNEGGTPITKPE